MSRGAVRCPACGSASDLVIRERMERDRAAVLVTVGNPGPVEVRGAGAPIVDPNTVQRVGVRCGGCGWRSAPTATGEEFDGLARVLAWGTGR